MLDVPKRKLIPHFNMQHDIDPPDDSLSKGAWLFGLGSSVQTCRTTYKMNQYAMLPKNYPGPFSIRCEFL